MGLPDLRHDWRSAVEVLEESLEWAAEGFAPSEAQHWAEAFRPGGGSALVRLRYPQQRGAPISRYGRRLRRRRAGRRNHCCGGETTRGSSGTKAPGGDPESRGVQSSAPTGALPDSPRPTWHSGSRQPSPSSLSALRRSFRSCLAEVLEGGPLCVWDDGDDGPGIRAAMDHFDLDHRTIGEGSELEYAYDFGDWWRSRRRDVVSPRRGALREARRDRRDAQWRLPTR